MIKQEEIHQRIPTNETVTLDGPITNHVTVVSADIVIMRHNRPEEPRTIHFNREMLVRDNTHSDFMLEKTLKIDDTLMALTTSGFISDIEGEVNVGFMSKVDLTGGQGMGVVVKGYNIRYVKSVLIEDKEPPVTTKLYPVYRLYNGKMPFASRYGVIKKFITDDVMVEHDTGWLLPGHKFDLLLMTMAPEWLSSGLVDATDTLDTVNIERLVVGLPGKATEVLELGKDFTATNITKQGASVMQIALVCGGETLAIAEICPDYGTIRLNTSGAFVRGYEVSVVRGNANRHAMGDIDLTKPTDNVLVDVKSGRTLTVQTGNTGWREVDLDTLVKESPNRPPLRKRQMFAIVLRTYAEGTGQDEFLRDLLELFPQQIHGLNLDGFVEVNKPSGGVVRGEYENIRPTFTFEEDADRLKGTVIENWLVTRFNSQDLPLADSTVDLLFIEPNDTMTEVCDAWYMRNGRPYRLRLPTSRRALTDDLSEDQDREIGLALEGQLWRGYTVQEIAGRALDLVNAYTSGPAADISARTAHQIELRELNDAIIAEIIKRLDGKESDVYQVA